MSSTRYDYDDLEVPPRIAREAGYVSNELNQYTRAQQTGGPAPFSTDLDHDADGNLIRMVSYGDANCDNALNNFDTDAFVAAVIDAQEEEPPQDYLDAGGDEDCWALRGQWGDLNGDGSFNNFDIDPYVTVLLGGASSPAYKTYVWDAENRLIEVHPAHAAGTTYSPAANDERWRYAYDYLGRRVEKHHEKYISSAWVTQSKTRFIYDGWNLLEELNVPTSGDPTVLRQFTWGLDLGGQSGGLQTSGLHAAAVARPPSAGLSGIHAAGGISGLLAVLDTNNTTTTSDDHSYAYLYDANGNVGQLVEWASGAGGASGDAWDVDRIVAKYEYDPYGNIVSKSGTYADTNPFRFSTKYFDAETGLYYYGYRYYSPRLGRWTSRDPIGEMGGPHLLCYVLNQPVGHIDPRGLLTWAESVYCSLPWNTACCVRALKLSTEMNDQLRHRYGALGIDGGAVNAMKHCVWMCKLANSSVCTKNMALRIGAAHEIWVGNPREHMHMDLNNNKCGVSITNNGSWPACFDACEKQLSDCLCWNKDDSLAPPRDRPTRPPTCVNTRPCPTPP